MGDATVIADAEYPSLSVAIPTYRREQILIDTIEALLVLRPRPVEILVLDQTEQHELATDRRLQVLATHGRIVWIRLTEPSITKAMNTALTIARGDVVLFLDDDIRPDEELFRKHCEAHVRNHEVLVAGRVIQPWQEKNAHETRAFHFATTRCAWIEEFMGGNFSIQRNLMIGLGGFDENFVRVAYHFEREFAWRFLRAGGRIFFEPGASIHHLKAPSGGTRTYGEHLDTLRPDHAVGAYYCYFRIGAVSEALLRPLRAVATRFHLRRPWRIPSTLIAEARGILWAWKLYRGGPRYLKSTERGDVA